MLVVQQLFFSLHEPLRFALDSILLWEVLCFLLGLGPTLGEGHRLEELTREVEHKLVEPKLEVEYKLVEPKLEVGHKLVEPKLEVEHKLVEPILVGVCIMVEPIQEEQAMLELFQRLQPLVELVQVPSSHNPYHLNHFHQQMLQQAS